MEMEEVRKTGGAVGGVKGKNWKEEEGVWKGLVEGEKG